MILIIDGFNLIYKFPELEGWMLENKLSRARNGILNLLIQYKKRRKQDKIHIFFDGKKEQGSMVVEDELEGMRIYYSHDIKADDYIKLFIQKSLVHNELYLVSSDKDLILHGKKYGCKGFKSEEFAKIINDEICKSINEEEKKSDVSLSNEEVEYWYSLFKGRKNAR